LADALGVLQVASSPPPVIVSVDSPHMVVGYHFGSNDSLSEADGGGSLAPDSAQEPTMQHLLETMQSMQRSQEHTLESMQTMQRSIVSLHARLEKQDQTHAHHEQDE
jgi:hypothetical protein